jgi:hypothetical protein
MVLKKLINKITRRKNSNKVYFNRFLKFYHLNKFRLNKKRRSLYIRKKKSGICVRCNRKATDGIVFCSYHQKKQIIYNHNSRLK